MDQWSKYVAAIEISCAYPLMSISKCFNLRQCYLKILIVAIIVIFYLDVVEDNVIVYDYYCHN